MFFSFHMYLQVLLNYLPLMLKGIPSFSPWSSIVSMHVCLSVISSPRRQLWEVKVWNISDQQNLLLLQWSQKYAYFFCSFMILVFLCNRGLSLKLCEKLDHLVSWEFHECGKKYTNRWGRHLQTSAEWRRKSPYGPKVLVTVETLLWWMGKERQRCHL